MIEVTDSSFQQEVLEADQPVLVDFWATWCHPCRQVGVVLEELSGVHPEMKFVKVNIDAAPDTASHYGILNVPVLGVYVGGELVKTILGAKPKLILKRELADWLQV